MIILRNALYISLIFVFAVTTVIALYRSVTIENGTIVGQRYDISDLKGWEFLGIPFARPPINELRFARPQPISRAWTKPLNATKPGNRCIQFIGGRYLDKIMNVPKLDEDCLYLNIWTPDNAVSKPRAVMIWIHGGAYQYGESYPFFNGRALAVIGDVVAVTIQYRLNLFGFLCLGESAPGNWGLWDQQMAIKWVSENIRQFGGDSSRITIFGESAGAASVSLHLLNSESLKYFRRAIIQSGSANTVWAAHENKTVLAENHQSFAVKAGCDKSTGTTYLLNCLRKMKRHQLLVTMYKHLDKKGFWIQWSPVVDGKFIKEAPNKTITEGRMEKREIILGFNTDEGTLFTSMKLYKPLLSQKKRFTPPHLYGYIKYIFQYNRQYPQPTSQQDFERIYQYFSDDPSNFTSNHMKLNLLTGDYYLICPMKALARAYASINSTVFFYKFVHRPRSSPFPSYTKATHADELRFIFAKNRVYSSLIQKFPMFNFSVYENQLSMEMIGYWTDFAKTGRPSHKWRRFTKREYKFKCALYL